MQINSSTVASKVSIITVSYNSQKDIELLVNHLFDDIESRRQFEIIVVSNSGDCTTLPDGYADCVVQSGGNVGFGRGCNKGAQVAHGQYLLFCNPDVRISSQDALRLCESLDRTPTIGMLSPSLQENKYQHDGPITIEENRVIGACLCISRKLFTELGGWDEGFFLWGEDRDLGTRVRNTGLKVAVHTGILARHLAGHSWKNTNSDNQKYLTQVWICSQVYYNFKHKGFLGAYSYLILDILKNIFRLCLGKQTFGRINHVPTSISFGLRLLFTLNLNKLVVFNGSSYPWETQKA